LRPHLAIGLPFRSLIYANKLDSPLKIKIILARVENNVNNILRCLSTTFVIKISANNTRESYSLGEARFIDVMRGNHHKNNIKVENMRNMPLEYKQ
jgi:hypothetical protein